MSETLRFGISIDAKLLDDIDRLIENHYVRDLSDKLTEHQYSYHHQIISALQVIM